MQTGTQFYTQEAAKTRRDQLILAHLPLVKHAIGRLVGACPAASIWKTWNRRGSWAWSKLPIALTRSVA